MSVRVARNLKFAGSVPPRRNTASHVIIASASVYTLCREGYDPLPIHPNCYWMTLNKADPPREQRGSRDVLREAV